MSNTKVAFRYAEAILDAVPDGEDAQRVVDDLLDVRASILASKELQLFFESPIISQKKKADAVDALFTGRIGTYPLKVLQLLIAKEREEYVIEIIDALLELRRQRQGILRTTIASAIELDESQRSKLSDTLAAATGKRIEAEYQLQPELMGGVLVRLGDTVYDGSVSNQLKRLHERFVSGR